MHTLKKTALYLLLAAALAIILVVLFFPFFSDCMQSAVTGQQDIFYTKAAAGEDGTLWAAGVQDGEWILAEGSGKLSRRTALTRLGIRDAVRVDALCADSDGGVVISVYESGNETLCQAWYLAAGEKTARSICSIPGGTGQENRIYGFSWDTDTLNFLVRQDGLVTAYRYYPEKEVTEKAGEVNSASWYALPKNGGGAVISDWEMTVGTIGNKVTISLEGVQVAAAWPLRDGAAILDATEGTLWKYSLSGRQRVLDLTDVPDVTDLNVSEDGTVTLLRDGKTLDVLENDVLRDESTFLYRQRWLSILMLAGILLAVLVVAAFPWYFLWEEQKMRVSLLLRQGVAAAAVLVILTASVTQWIVQPWFQRSAAAQAERYLSGVSTEHAGSRIDGSEQEGLEILALFQDTSDSLLQSLMHPDDSGVTGEGSSGTSADVSAPADSAAASGETSEAETGETEEPVYPIYSVQLDTDTILPVLFRGSAFRQAARTALEEGTAFVTCTMAGTVRCVLFTRTEENWLRVVSVPEAGFLAEAETEQLQVVLFCWAVALFAWIMILVILATLLWRLHRVTTGLDALQGGYAHVEVVDRAGDEITATAESLNSLAKNGMQRGHAATGYERFLPDQIIHLLGVTTVEEITKQTFHARKMITMHVSFFFTDDTGEDESREGRSRELFNSINEVMERVSSIILERGGTIFSLASESFQALFDANSTSAVGAAVAVRQEIIDLNQMRQERHQPVVCLHIALDTGEVMLGVVGNDTQMQVTAISTGFNTTQILTSLFSRFEANILCTERMVHLTEGYGVRYIGKTKDGTELLRVYEIFDGDDYAVRQGKAWMSAQFASGIYTIYSGEYVDAKRIFMEIVRQNSGDGVARFYLYLADRFEKEPPEVVSLDAGD